MRRVEDTTLGGGGKFRFGFMGITSNSSDSASAFVIQPNLKPTSSTAKTLFMAQLPKHNFR